MVGVGAVCAQSVLRDTYSKLLAIAQDHLTSCCYGNISTLYSKALFQALRVKAIL